jgi:hypothetical protein
MSKTLHAVLLLAVVGTFAVHAAPVKPNKVTPLGPLCRIEAAIPIYTNSLAANDENTLAIVDSTSYYKPNCFRATVDFLIAPQTPGPDPHPYEDFYFSSLGSELVDTKSKCNTYQQTTEIYLLDGDSWSQQDQGRIVGAWSGGKCHFKIANSGNDFRAHKYTPAQGMPTRYRVMTTVTTGPGLIWGPNSQPSKTISIVAKTRGLAKPNAVCFAVEHQHNNNTPIVGCADPNS